MIKHFISAAYCVALVGLISFSSNGLSRQDESVQSYTADKQITKTNIKNFKIWMNAVKAEQRLFEQDAARVQSEDFLNMGMKSVPDEHMKKLEKLCDNLQGRIERFKRAGVEPNLVREAETVLENARKSLDDNRKNIESLI